MKPWDRQRSKLAVEIAAETVKWAVAVETGGEFRVAEAGVFPALPGPALAERFARLLRKHRVRPEDVVACVPRSQVTARNLELPSTVPAEIRKIVDLQAVKQTPYSADEVLYDYYVLKAFREGYSSVMLVVAHRSVINEHLRRLQEAGLRPGSVTLTTECAAAWARGAPEGQAEGIVAALDVDAHEADFFIAQGGQLLFTQPLSVGAERMAGDAAAWKGKLLAEMARALQIYRSEEIAREPSVLAVTGASEALRPYLAELAQATGLPVKEVAVPERQRAAFGDVPADGASFTAVLGLAEHPAERPPINLYPQELLLKSSLVEKGRSLMLTGVLALALCLTVVASFAGHYYRRQGYLRWLEQQTAFTEAEAQASRRAKAAIGQVVELRGANARVFEAVRLVRRSMPQAVYLTEMNIVRDRRLQLTGRAESMGAVFEFMNALKTHALFSELETKRLTKRMVNNQEVVDFEIVSRLQEAARGPGGTRP
jgi:Tfp pilus assembly PilM family ATPase